MKIALVISSLGGGGAERVMATLANAWVLDGVEVTLITLANRTQDVYPLSAKVQRIVLDLVGESSGLLRAVVNNLTRVWRLRAVLRACKPDAVISFMTTTNLLTLLACYGLACPVLVSERAYIGAQPPRGVWQCLYRPLYRRAAVVVAQTRHGAEYLEARLGRRISIVPNPLRETEGGARNVSAQLPRMENQRWVLAVGRLSAEKGFDLLIAAFSRVTAGHGQWHLAIAGEGPERGALTTQIAELGLAGRVHLLGFSDDPQSLMRQADLFVLSSRYEGMPNALLEAMGAGCPCISFDCKTGPGELIEHGTNGWLVAPDDVARLADALENLMVDAGLRHRLGVAAKEVKDRFGLVTVLAQWNALLSVATAEHKEACMGSSSKRLSNHES